MGKVLAIQDRKEMQKMWNVDVLTGLVRREVWVEEAYCLSIIDASLHFRLLKGKKFWRHKIGKNVECR